MGDWPIKEYLKVHFNNQQAYKCCNDCKCAADEAIGKVLDNSDDWGNNSVVDAHNEKDGEDEEDEGF